MLDRLKFFGLAVLLAAATATHAANDREAPITALDHKATSPTCSLSAATTAGRRRGSP
jgi:hypothetical protein